MSSNITEAHINEFKKSPVPVVLAGTIEDSAQIPSVNIVYEQAVMDAITSLTDRGHKNIAMVTGSLQNAIIKTKMVPGYRKALEAANIPYNEVYLVETDMSYDDGMETLKQLMELDNKPTAIFVNSDEAALGVIHAAQDLGISIPEDIEVVSSDNTRLSLMVRPRLTTIVQPLYDIGAVSMRLLTKLMNKENVDESAVILPYRIEERDSTK